MRPRGIGGAPALPVRPWSAVSLVVASALGLVAFAWPLLVHRVDTGTVAHTADAPWVLVGLVPMMIAVVVAGLAEGGLDAKAVAVLGVLAACGCGLRFAGAGVAGFEPVFFLLIPAGRVFGRGFGFVLGALTLLASAMLIGGVGPWLPYQMLGAGWVGLGAGCLPHGWWGRPLGARAEVGMLAGYAVVAALGYGLVLDLWFWPFGTGGAAPTRMAFEPGAGLGENLGRFWGFYLTTSLGFDLVRAVTLVGLTVVGGRAVLAALRRTSRRAAFDAPVRFETAGVDS